jgi:acetoin utilization deacetylase AcuC-like enzyme/GNAT superfamily N-acetyltransferase
MSDMPPQIRARLAYDPAELCYDFGGNHPFQARRLSALIDLLESSGLWRNSDPRQVLPFQAATTDELALVHTQEYIQTVQQLSLSKEEQRSLSKEERDQQAELARRHGFDEGDTPPISGMHDAASLIVGGTLTALSAVMGLTRGGHFATEEARPLHVFHPAGGLHHAWADRASGFCVYNDAAVAIAHVLRATEAKILYLDFDAHHGDGVQRAFYDEPRVMTISLHETGHYLFPGSGDVLEVGQGAGRGYSVNVPLEPFTEDESYQEVMNTLLPPLVLSFAPDVIISQHGCDTHAWDPLTHLALTLHGIQAQVQLAHRLAHTYCDGRWVALGGGGYDQFRVVPRAWSLLWAEMSEQPVPAHLPKPWITRWRPVWEREKAQEEQEQEVMGKEISAPDFPTTFEDQAGDFHPQPRRWSIGQENLHTAAMVRRLLLPPVIRQAFSRDREPSPIASMIDVLHIRDRATPSRSQTVETAKGSLLLRDFCPPSLVERLQVESGMCAFTRVPEREHQLLLTIAKSPDCALTLAHTPAGEIVGEVSLAPGEEWFKGLVDVYEVAIEVSSHWRGLGLARALLAFALEFETREDVILFAMGLSWHWDMQGLSISEFQYRDLIARLFASQGFVEYTTTEPDIRSDPANILLVRIGKRVDPSLASRFHRRIGGQPRARR